MVLTLTIMATLCTVAFRSDQPRVVAQENPPSETLFTVDLNEGQFPIAPSFVRLLRITLAPGASSPLHTHPGPEIALVEQGVLTVQVNGSAEIAQPAAEGTPVAASSAPNNSEFELQSGEIITYFPQTPMTFRNAGDAPVSLLTAVMLPAGNQHPPGITYIDGQPAAEAFDGVAPEILGDGVATVLPGGGLTLTVERLRIAAGEPIPAFNEPVMISLESGVLDFTVVGGKVQVSRTATPGPQPDSAPETVVSLAKSDAVFFPLGMREVDRSAIDGELVLLRMTLSQSTQEEAPTAADTGVGEIRVLASELVEPPASPSAGEGAAEASPTATGEPVLEEGALVESNADGVNVRAGAGTDFDIVTQVFIGDQMRITGESEESGDFVWWPVEIVDDPSITGYIAEDFIDLVDEQ
ncbi:MAG: cupin domain-containing protein [Thermomicrobiales bacterium]